MMMRRSCRVRTGSLRGIPRLGPRRDRRELVAGHGAGLAVRHRRLAAADREHLADRRSERSDMMAAERIARHLEVVELLLVGLLAGARMAARAILLEYGLGLVEGRALVGEQRRLLFVGAR